MRDLTALPMARRNPLPHRERLKAIRDFHTGPDTLRDAGGPVTRVVLGPKWLIPPIVLATSPRGIRDIVSVRDGSIDKTSTVATELRRLLGGNLFVLAVLGSTRLATRSNAGTDRTTGNHGEVQCKRKFVIERADFGSADERR
jgi:hypothetical protein